jgi:4-diphosphocytidyl-2-C-methyl-D-erythritol kinase
LKKNPFRGRFRRGSSDAAAALDMIRTALQLQQDEALFSAASESGSDVPFFLKGGIAFAEGRGEILQQIINTSISRCAC